jgi:hypothetical protein
MDNFIRALLGAALVITMLFGLALLMAYPIMWMWNYTFPAAFGLPTITVWQSLWGTVCVRFIFFGLGTYNK